VVIFVERFNSVDLTLSSSIRTPSLSAPCQFVQAHRTAEVSNRRAAERSFLPQLLPIVILVFLLQKCYVQSVVSTEPKG
jgi:ABC-type dipeptide/oligopeptide/nickel transport system permease subunit